MEILWYPSADLDSRSKPAKEHQCKRVALRPWLEKPEANFWSTLEATALMARLKLARDPDTSSHSPCFLAGQIGFFGNPMECFSLRESQACSHSWLVIKSAKFIYYVLHEPKMIKTLNTEATVMDVLSPSKNVVCVST